MSLVEQTLFGKVHKVDDSIKLLRDTMPKEGYWAGNSGGKDSAVLDDLLIRAGVKYDSHYSVTTIDPSPLIYNLRENYPHTIFDKPKMPLLKKLIVSGYPDAEYRWCCRLYKERGGGGRLCTLGLRRDEGHNRGKRKIIELCYKDPSKRIVNPLLIWTEDNIWQYIHENKLPYCKLYAEGFKRLGCIGCPLKQKKERLYDFERFPKWRNVFIKAFQKRIKYQRERNLKNAYRWDCGEDAFNWWINSERH